MDRTYAALLALPLLALPALETRAVPNPAAQEKADRPPSSREQKALIEALYSVEAYRVSTRKSIDELLAPYSALPAPTGSKRKALDKALHKAWSKLRELPTKGGEHWYWEDDRRGRFFVAGKGRKPKGLFIGLHGGGLGSADASGSYSAYQGAVSKRGWVSIYPQALEATEHGWTDSGTEPWIMSLIDEARRSWEIPPDRVYIGGHSMGGYGSWVLGAHHADLFAAALPSAGAPTPILDRATNRIVDIQEGVIPNLRNLPMCVFQSTDDPRVPADVNQAAVERVMAAKEEYGGYENVTYWEVDDRGHGYPEGGVDALLERIENFERDPWPEKVVWQPALGWRNSFYWLDWVKPRENAIIVATLDREKNSIDVRSDGRGVGGLGVLLSPEIVDMESEVTVRVDGRTVFEDIPTTSWSVFVRTSLPRDPGRVYLARIPLDV